MASNSSAPLHQPTSSLTDLLHQLDASRSLHRVYNSLVVIRTRYSKGSDAVTKLRRHGAIEKLLMVLKEFTDVKCHDVALSILGNCCLDDKSRLRVLKVGGIDIICKLLQSTERESVRNRACRTLANLCENVACCDVVHDDHSDVIATIVTSLSTTEDIDCKVTYCRAIRLLSDTVAHRDAVLRHKALKFVVALLSSDSTSVVSAAIKTLALYIPNCCEETTRQLVAAEAIASLVALTTQSSGLDVVSLASGTASISASAVDVGSAASSLLLSIASSAPLLCPYLGRSNAVDFLLNHIKAAMVDLSTNKVRGIYRLIDALCHCCRDSNNRIVIRDADGLSLFVEILKCDDLDQIHDRVISSVVCFMFDDAALLMLLRCGIMQILPRHLYRSANIALLDDDIGFERFKFDFAEDFELSSSVAVSESASEVSVERDLSSEADPEVTFQTGDKSETTADCEWSTLLLDNTLNLETLPVTADPQTIEVDVCPVLPSSQGPNITCPLVLPLATLESEANLVTLEEDPAQLADDSGVRTENLLPCSSSDKLYKYSIDSPTYKAVSSWRMESMDFHDGTCPRNIYEGARLFGNGGNSPTSSGLSPSSSYCGSVPGSPHNSCISSCHSWSSISGISSPAVSPSWSLDSAGSDVAYSPLSTSSFINPFESVSPASFRANDPQTSELSGLTSESDNIDGRGLETPKDQASDEEEKLNILHKEIQKDEWENEVESDSEEVDIETFQRNREDQRRLSRLIDIASSMYAASSATAPSSDSTTSRKPKRPCSSSASKTSLKHPRLSSSNVSLKDEATTGDDASSASGIEPQSIVQPIAVEDAKTPSVVAGNIAQRLETLRRRSLAMGKITQQNIIALLSRVSHSPTTIVFLLDIPLLCSLLDYINATDRPHTSAQRILLRLSRSHMAFELAVLRLFPLLADRRLGTKCCRCTIARKPVKKKSTEGTKTDGALPAKTDDTEAGTGLKDAKGLRTDILANLSVLAASGYGKGILLHMLLCGNESQRQRCALSLCFLCRNADLRTKYLADMKVSDLLMQMLSSPKSLLFRSTVFAISHLIQSLPLVIPELTNDDRSKTPARTDAKPDVVFLLGNQRRVTASRTTMCDCSDVFAAMLCGGFRESNQSEISIPHANPDAFQVVVDWCHGIPLESDIAFDMLLEALSLVHRFQLDTVLYQQLFWRLVASVFDRSEHFMRVINAISLYGCNGSERDCVVLLFKHSAVTLQQRCNTIADIVSGKDAEAFTNVIAATLLDTLD